MAMAFDALTAQIIEHLPSVYPRHNSSYFIKGYIIRFSVEVEGTDEDGEEIEIFHAWAVAELRLPDSLTKGMEVPLEDEFMFMRSETSHWDALEKMWEYIEAVEEKVKEERMTDGMFFTG
jgi:hypothetical protein